MRVKALLTLFGAAVMAGTALAPLEPVSAQIPAFLPNKETVAPGEPMAIDGDWHVNTIDRVIRIERGRAYAVEGWTHAFILSVQPDMVTIRNIQQVNETEYVGDDLPMMARVTLRVVSPDRIEATVPGLLGPARYTLTRVAGSGAVGEGPPTFQQATDPGTPSSPPDQRFASLAEAFGPPRAVAETFRGCPIPDRAVRESSASGSQDTPRDRVTGRQFAPVADEQSDVDLGDACWRRLDGVWVENRDPAFDTSKNDGSAWDVQGQALAGLLHGNYTTPETLFIAPSENSEDELWVMSGTGEVRFTRFASSDGASIESLIGQTGVTKRYEADGGSSLGGELTVDYTAGNEMRIRLGNRQFVRPDRPADNDLSMDDVFVIQYQTDNFAANLKGYDVLTQDPFQLMNNTKGEVFSRRDRDEYRIQEKYAVPFGFTLRNELLQGNVYRRTFNSSEREIQESSKTAFGENATISYSGAVNSMMAAIPGAGQMSDTGLSVGRQSSRETMSAMRNSQSVAQLVGYSRAKSYAIIVDHSDAKLSGDFLTAVEDARIAGDYRALVNRFGTHYAYAVTYGASAKMTQDISEEAFSTVLSETEGDRTEAELRIHGSSVGGFNESMRGGLNGTSGSIGNEGGRFVAVGGNGSWDSGGYSRGDRVAPILLDLRPLDELLNPINFPNQPEVYTRVRAELAQSINAYLASQSGPLSNERLISKVAFTPKPPPEPEAEIEEWHVYVRQISCKKVGVGTTKAVSGDVRITGIGYRNAFAREKDLRVSCERDNPGRKKYDYPISDNTPGLMILRGTREQIRGYQLKFDLAWNYEGVVTGKNRSSQKSLTNTPLQKGGLAVGKSDTTTWVISPNKRPEVRVYLRVKRIK
ncbi:MAG: MAC/perforin domain-containing protein [Pseudomonadota bacterium]